MLTRASCIVAAVALYVLWRPGVHDLPMLQLWVESFCVGFLVSAFAERGH